MTTAESTTDTAVPRWGYIAIAAWVGLVIGGYVGTALGTTWANNHPLGLIALHARVRHLLLALGNDLVWWQYGIVAGLRLGASYAVCHLLGRAFGNRILNVFGRYMGVTNESIDAIEVSFDKVDWLIVPWFTGSNLMAAFTGIRKMNPLRVTVLVSIGIALRLALFWWLARIFDDELGKVLDFLGRYQRPFLIGSIVVVVAVIAINVRRGRSFSR